jgi:hypothetical protein
MDQEIITNLTTDITDLVSEITFDSTAKINVTMDNGLPVNLTMALIAPELNIDPAAQNFPALTNTSVDWNGLANYNMTIASLTDSANDADTDIDMDVIVNLDDGDGDDSILTLSNITIPPGGVTYDFSATVTAVLDIAQVVINSATMPSMEFPEGAETLDFSLLGDFLPDAITFPSISAGLDFDIPAGTGMSMELEVYASYTDSLGVPKNLLILGTDSDSDGIPETPRTLIEADLGTPLDLSMISTLINERATNIKFHYDVTVSGATVNISGAGESFGAIINAEIPLEMFAATDAEILIDGASVIPAADSDLFGRDGSDDSETNQYLDFLKSASVNLTFSNPLPHDAATDLLGIRFIMEEDPLGLDPFILERTLIIKPGVTTSLNIGLTPAQIDRMVDDPSFEPEYHIYLMGDFRINNPPDDIIDNIDYDGYHSLVEGFDLTLAAWMELKSDVDYTINVGGAN